MARYIGSVMRDGKVLCDSRPIEAATEQDAADRLFLSLCRQHIELAAAVAVGIVDFRVQEAGSDGTTVNPSLN